MSRLTNAISRALRSVGLGSTDPKKHPGAAHTDRAPTTIPTTLAAQGAAGSQGTAYNLPGRSVVLGSASHGAAVLQVAFDTPTGNAEDWVTITRSERATKPDGSEFRRFFVRRATSTVPATTDAIYLEVDSDELGSVDHEPRTPNISPGGAADSLLRVVRASDDAEGYAEGADGTTSGASNLPRVVPAIAAWTGAAYERLRSDAGSLRAVLWNQAGTGSVQIDSLNADGWLNSILGLWVNSRLTGWNGTGGNGAGWDRLKTLVTGILGTALTSDGTNAARVRLDSDGVSPYALDVAAGIYGFEPSGGSRYRIAAVRNIADDSPGEVSNNANLSTVAWLKAVDDAGTAGVRLKAETGGHLRVAPIQGQAGVAGNVGAAGATTLRSIDAVPASAATTATNVPNGGGSTQVAAPQSRRMFAYVQNLGAGVIYAAVGEAATVAGSLQIPAGDCRPLVGVGAINCINTSGADCDVRVMDVLA